MTSMLPMQPSARWSPIPLKTDSAPSRPRIFCGAFEGFYENDKTQGMGTLVRREAPNGEVPRPLRSFCVFVETGNMLG